MRIHRRAMAVAAGATAVLAATIFAVTPAHADVNLLTNPGFESGSLSGWTCEAGASVVSGQARTGTYALAGTPGSTTAKCSQTVAVQANTRYVYSAYVRGSYVFIGTTGVVTTSTWTPNAGSYSQLTLTVTPTTSGSLTVYVHGWYGQPVYHADDVSLLGPGTAPTQPPTTTTQPPTTTTRPPTTTHAADHDDATPAADRPAAPALPDRVLAQLRQRGGGAAPVGRARRVRPRRGGVRRGDRDAGRDPVRARPGPVELARRLHRRPVPGRHQHAARPGQAGHPVGRGELGRVQVASSAAATAFSNSAFALMQSYGFDGIDIDLENGLVHGPGAALAAIGSGPTSSSRWLRRRSTCSRPAGRTSSWHCPSGTS